jgi:hypothetical protein
LSGLGRAARRLSSSVVVAFVAGLLMAPGAVAEGQLIMQPDEVDFGAVKAGMRSSSPVTVRNIGADPVALGDVWLLYDEEETAEPFSVDLGSCEDVSLLAAGAECQLMARFDAPLASEYFEALVVVEGDGVEPGLALLAAESDYDGFFVARPTAVTFPVTPAGSVSDPQSIVVGNGGGDPVAITRIGIMQPTFKIVSNSCPSSLMPGAECVVQVVFAPVSGRRDQTAHLMIHGDLFTSWLWIPMTGHGSADEVPSDPELMIDSDLVRLSEGIPKLLRGGPRHGRLAPFRVWLDGTLSVRVHGWTKGRRVLLASGSRSLSSGIEHRLQVTLTKKGRKLLRRPKKTRVRAVVSFAARDGELSRQSLELMVKPPKAEKKRAPR